MILRMLRIAGLWLALIAPALASQATLVTPGPPLPMSSLASFLNSAFLSVGSCNAGSSAPVNGTGGTAFAGECWINTTSNPWVFNYTADGTHWSEFGTLNTSTFVFTPYSGSSPALISGNNLSDVANAVTAFANIVQPSTASALGGVKSLTCGSHNWFTALSTLGVYTCSQPAIGDISGWGTGVATALGVNIGSAGAPVLFGGAGGTPSSLTLTNATGLPFAGLPSGTSDTVLGYWGSTVISAIAINNCSNSLTYSTSSHAFGCSTSTGSSFVNSTASVSGASTTYTSGQNLELILRSNSGSPMIDTLPGTSPGILPANTLITVKNNDTAGVLAINVGSGATMKAQAGPTGWVYVCPGQSMSWYSDGSVYWGIHQPPTCYLKASTTFYGAASGGSATNHGLTSAAPLDSCAHAYQLPQSSFNAGLLNPYTPQTITIQCGTPGVGSQTFGATTFNGPIPGQLQEDVQLGSTPVIIQGDTTTPGNITFSSSGVDAVLAEGGASFLLQGFAMTAASFGNDLDCIGPGSKIAYKTVNFGTAATNHVDATHRCMIEVAGNYNLTGTGASSHWLVSDGGSIYVQTATAINYVTNQTWGSAFVAGQYSGSNVVFNFTPTYVGTGSNTGAQYSFSLNSVLNTGHAGTACGSAFSSSVLPGTAGSCSTGGQID